MAFLITLPRLITRFSSAWVLCQSVKSNSFALHTRLWTQIKEAKRSFAKPLLRMLAVQCSVSNHNYARGGLSSFQWQLIGPANLAADTQKSGRAREVGRKGGGCGIFHFPKARNPRREM